MAPLVDPADEFGLKMGSTATKLGVELWIRQIWLLVHLCPTHQIGADQMAGLKHAALNSGARVSGTSKKVLRKENKQRRIQKQVK